MSDKIGPKGLQLRAMREANAERAEKAAATERKVKPVRKKKRPRRG